MNIFEEDNSKFAVITGASTGIGFELAKVFAENKYDILIAAKSEKIFEAQEELEKLGGMVLAIQVDLAHGNGVVDLHDYIRAQNRQVDVMAINAGVGVGGDFSETKFREEINLINLNVLSCVHLTKLMLKDFYLQGSGKFLFTSSISSVMPSSFEAVYGASKAFITSFANAIRNEAKDRNVQVTILMPGPTHTNFFHRAHMDDTQVGSEGKLENEPDQVARQAFEALMAGRDQVFSSSLKTKMQGWATKFLPEKFKAEMHRKMSEPGSAKH